MGIQEVINKPIENPLSERENPEASTMLRNSVVGDSSRKSNQSELNTLKNPLRSSFKS